MGEGGLSGFLCLLCSFYRSVGLGSSSGCDGGGLYEGCGILWVVRKFSVSSSSEIVQYL